jgi:hypothetical protein
MLIHGWPGSIVEFLALIEPLTHPENGAATCAGLQPGFGTFPVVKHPKRSRGGKFVHSFSAVLLLGAAAFLMQSGQAQTDSASPISLSDRIYVASRVYGTIQSYFNVWPEKDGIDFDQSYRDYLQNILHTEDRKAFDLETMRFVALLHNGHSWFNDNWLQDHYGSALGFYAEPIQRQWVVTRSDLPQLRLGDVIAGIDGKPTEDFFQNNRQFLADSNERSEQTDLFAQAYLFPQRFELTLADGRKVSITRGGYWHRDGASAGE